MTDRVTALMTLMQDVEEGDSLDFGALPLDETETRKLVALSMLKMAESLSKLDVPAEERELVLLATAGHLVLENLVLHYHRLIAQGHGVEETASQLLDRLRKGA